MSANLDKVNQATNLHKRNEVQFLCFRLAEDGDIYAINVFKVIEIIKYVDTITRLNYDDNALLEGIITVRDKIYPLVDLKKWFAYDSTNLNLNIKDNKIDGEIFQILICDFSQTILAVKIYKAERILTKRWSEIQQVVNYSKEEANHKVINHTKYFSNELVKIVNVERMLIDVFPNIENTQNSEINELQKVISQKEVLLAEDSPVAMKMMKKILDKLEVKVRAFENGQLLLDYLNADSTNVGNVGLIITDLEMPIASGFEVIKQVKNSKKFSHIPITVNSSMSGNSNKEMAISLNADDFISKSHPKEVEETIKRFFL
jgi:two-component system, chemotaxis family, chemotaxis protein CheV